MVDRAIAPAPDAQPAFNLSKESLATVLAPNLPDAAPNSTSRNVIRVTNSVAQYDVSCTNPNALQNLGKAIAGSLDRDDFTYQDPERGVETKLGDVLITVDLSNPDQIVLCHHDTAGKGALGRVIRSVDYMVRNPLNTIGMKVLGITTDPEVVYKQKVTQLLAQLDREGLFGQPGASTFNLSDWEIDTRSAWRDVVIRRAEKPAPEFHGDLSRASLPPIASASI